MNTIALFLVWLGFTLVISFMISVCAWMIEHRHPGSLQRLFSSRLLVAIARADQVDRVATRLMVAVGFAGLGLAILASASDASALVMVVILLIFTAVSYLLYRDSKRLPHA